MEQTLEYIFLTPEPPSENTPTRVPRSFPLHVTRCISLRTVFSAEETSRVRSSVLGLKEITHSCHPGQRTQILFQFMTLALGMAQKSVSSWMPIVLITRCRVRRRATLVRRATTTAVSATMVAPAARRNQTQGIINFSSFVSVHFTP